jgi:hypothetical protein
MSSVAPWPAVQDRSRRAARHWKRITYPIRAPTVLKSLNALDRRLLVGKHPLCQTSVARPQLLVVGAKTRSLLPQLRVFVAGRTNRLTLQPSCKEANEHRKAGLDDTLPATSDVNARTVGIN